VLLQGAEEVRRAAAESLATNPEEGHLALTEGSTMEDLLVRRAVVYGLIRIKQPWAIQILEKMEIEDSQWIVRTAASQALEEVRKPDIHIPKGRPPLHQVPWLIVYASKLGIGVAPGKPAVDLLMMVLKNGDTEQRLAAMEYLMRNPTEAAIQPLYDLLYSAEGNLREAVYNTLQNFAASGIHLPSPTQFGLGAPV
jgi:HEAT repeat protein